MTSDFLISLDVYALTLCSSMIIIFIVLRLKSYFAKGTSIFLVLRTAIIIIIISFFL